MSIKNLIWYEKYRQTELKNLILRKESKKQFKKFIKDEEIPHLLFHGPPGSGKTTLANILLNKCSSRKLILNGSSDDRGIATIKGKVKIFAKLERTTDKKNIIFFDEADGMTIDSQDALKSTMEKYQSNCRFIFTCNNINKISDAILSRCRVYYFTSIPKDELLLFLNYILDQENVQYKEKDVKQIMNQFYPDVRTVINNLQDCCFKGKLKVYDDSHFSKNSLKELQSFLLHGKLTKARTLWKESTDFVWLYKWLFDVFIFEIPEKIRADISIIIAEYLYKNTSVTDKEINASACILEIMAMMEVTIDFRK